MLADLTLYAVDAVATARILLAADRLADLLAEGRPLEMAGIRLVNLETGERTAHDRLVIDLDVILAVATGEPRGNPGRRLATVVYPATALTGPYRIDGELHGPPSMDAFEVANRRTWVPLTQATIAYRAGARDVRTTSSVILVHRPLVARLLPSDRDEAVLSRTAGGWPTDTDSSSHWR